MKTKLILAVVSVLMIGCLSASMCCAEGWGALGGAFGLSDAGDLPSFDGAFTGSTVQVQVDGKTYTIHENFKLVMDQYEAFFDEYIQFMQNPDMMQYTTMMAKYASAMTALESLDEHEMSDAELAYYTAVLMRINQKLMNVAMQ